MSDSYDCIVIGKGLVGSAAAKYLGKAGLQVLLVGPDEPEDIQTHRGVFAAHYDASRATRALDVDPVWSILASRSQKTYASLEEESGISFHSPVGRLRISGQADDAIIEKECEVADGLGLPFETLTSELVADRYPYLHTGSETTAVFEDVPAGYINPRELIKAQLIIADKSGVEVVRKIAVKLKRENESWVCTDRSGNSYTANRVLVTAGAYSNMLLPRAVGFQILRETLLLAEISEEDAESLSAMPVIGYRDPVLADPIIGEEGIYLFPPVKYPDDRWYLKIGLNSMPDRELDSGEQAREWFHGNGDTDIAEILEQALASVLPDINVLATRGKPCIHAYTVHNRPYIGKISVSGLHIAAGGCGEAAKSSDEIGRLAAELISEKGWQDKELRPDDFLVVAARS